MTAQCRHLSESKILLQSIEEKKNYKYACCLSRSSLVRSPAIGLDADRLEITDTIPMDVHP